MYMCMNGERENTIGLCTSLSTLFRFYLRSNEGKDDDNVFREDHCRYNAPGTVYRYVSTVYEHIH